MLGWARKQMVVGGAKYWRRCLASDLQVSPCLYEYIHALATYEHTESASKRPNFVVVLNAKHRGLTTLILR